MCVYILILNSNKMIYSDHWVMVFHFFDLFRTSKLLRPPNPSDMPSPMN